MITLQEARELQVGTVLEFGTEYTYEVTAFEIGKSTVHLYLDRNDGYRTFATEHDLRKANFITKPGVPAELSAEQIEDIKAESVILTAAQAAELSNEEPEQLSGEGEAEPPIEGELPESSEISIEDEPPKKAHSSKKSSKKA